MLLWYYTQYSTLALVTYPYNVNIYKFIKFITICSRLKMTPQRYPPSNPCNLGMLPIYKAKKKKGGGRGEVLKM